MVEGYPWNSQRGLFVRGVVIVWMLPLRLFSVNISGLGFLSYIKLLAIEKKEFQRKRCRVDLIVFDDQLYVKTWGARKC